MPKLLLVVSLVGAALASCDVRDEGAPGVQASDTRQQQARLQAQLVVQNTGRYDDLFVTLTNPTADPFCIYEEVLEPKYQHIRLIDAAGQPVNLKVMAEREWGGIQGVDLRRPIVVVPAMRASTYYLGFDDFELTAGRYAYDMVFIYFSCNEIFDTAANRSEKPAVQHVAHVTGQINAQQR
jgi:hypothetical protein